MLKWTVNFCIQKPSLAVTLSLVKFCRYSHNVMRQTFPVTAHSCVHSRSMFSLCCYAVNILRMDIRRVELNRFE